MKLLILSSNNGEGHNSAAKALMEQVRKFAESSGSRLFSMCETNGLSCFEKVPFESVDLSTSAIFGRI